MLLPQFSPTLRGGCYGGRNVAARLWRGEGGLYRGWRNCRLLLNIACVPKWLVGGLVDEIMKSDTLLMVHKGGK